MANYINHTRYRALTYEYARLNLSNLKLYASSPNGYEFLSSWTSGFSLKLKRVKKGLFVFTSEDMGYLIPIDQTAVTFGKRLWYRCPICKRRCGILYHAGAFACRECVKPAYESQNGSEQDYLADRIRKARRKLWGEEMAFFVDNLTDSCQWWPKPSQIHRQRFEREKAKIVRLEQRYWESVPERYRYLVFEYMKV